MDQRHWFSMVQFRIVGDQERWLAYRLSNHKLKIDTGERITVVYRESGKAVSNDGARTYQPAKLGLKLS